jgi:hypothetical protein
MTRRLVWLAVLLLVAAAVVAVLPVAVALVYTWRSAFPDRRRSTLPEWIGAAALVWIATRVRLNTRAIKR